MNKSVGVLGGGQLGRMFTEAANNLNIKVVSLDASHSPAKQVAAHNQHITGSFRDPTAIKRLAAEVDVLTVEIEHVDTETLEDIATGDELRPDWRRVKIPKAEVQPHWETIRVIQDKYEQKEWLTKHGVAVARSIAVEEPGGKKEIANAVRQVGFPAMLKARKEAYDGRGNFVVEDESKVAEAAHALADRELYVEEWASFERELAVMVVKIKNDAGEDWRQSTLAFPTAETVHEDSICKLVYVPPRNVAKDKRNEAQELARKAVASFPGKGVFGVEMFLLEDGKLSLHFTQIPNLALGELLINEIAPRPHNSGHYTIEACAISQFEAHLRAILDLPLSQEDLEADRSAVMLNILGGLEGDTHLKVAREALKARRAAVHLYGKGDSRPGRKMGHVTVTARSLQDAEDHIKPLIRLVDEIRAERFKHRRASTVTKLAEKKLPPIVAVTMGSDSDLNVLLPGIKLLDEFKVPYYITITSAHRTPLQMVKFAEDAASRGIKVIIAAAGGAAHLPGMIAAISRLPIIGVPVKASTLDGLDSLLSIVQMPVRRRFQCSIPAKRKIERMSRSDSGDQQFSERSPACDSHPCALRRRFEAEIGPTLNRPDRYSYRESQANRKRRSRRLQLDTDIGIYLVSSQTSRLCARSLFKPMFVGQDHYDRLRLVRKPCVENPTLYYLPQSGVIHTISASDADNSHCF